MSTLSLAAPHPAGERRRPVPASHLPETASYPLRRAYAEPLENTQHDGRLHTDAAPPPGVRLQRRVARGATIPAETPASKLPPESQSRPGAACPAQRMRYGPRSAPLFYTALREPPGRLTWEAWPQAMAYRVTVGRFTDAEPAPLIAMTLSGETCSLSLRDLSVRPGAVYAWRVEPICPEAPAIGAEEEETCDAAGFSYEGRFWLLDADMTARWERGQALFEPMPDPDFRAIAQALMLAEVGLYHEALLHIRNGSVRQERQARTVLAHTAQALIYRQMAQRLEVEENRDVPGGRSPACFAAWVAAREEYHRKQVTGQLPCGAKTATRTSSTDGLEWTRQQIGTQTRRAA